MCVVCVLWETATWYGMLYAVRFDTPKEPRIQYVPHGESSCVSSGLGS